MNRYVRILLIVLGLIEIALCIGFLLNVPFVLALWPWPAMSPLSYLLLASAFATAATITLWPALMNEPSAVWSVGQIYIVVMVAVGIFAFQSMARTGNAAFRNFGAVMLLGAVIGVGLMRWSWRIPFRDKRPLPALVRWSFVGFIIPLVLAGSQMIFKRPNILPWNVTPELNVIFGWLFLAAAGYFIYGLIRPGWANGAPHLAAFLVYDAVLLLPFLQRLPSAAPEHRTNLIIYVVVLVYSALLAIYMLFINGKTRVIGKAS